MREFDSHRRLFARSVRSPPFRAATAVALLAVTPGVLSAQSVLDRSPNLGGGWVAPPGTLQFDFVHRFSVSPAPEHKVTSVPSFLLAAGLPWHTMVGFVYSTNSTLVSRYPNAWEFFVQAAPWRQDAGNPLDVGAQAGYSLAAEGFVGELSAARRMGRLRLLAATRALADPTSSAIDLALGGGVAVRLGRWVALAGDVTSLVDRGPGESVAWSAGLQLGIPHTPHTLSLQVSNAAGVSLEEASRGTGQAFYGFEFTIPITLKRYAGGAPDRPPAGVAPDGDSTVVIHIKSLAFGAGTVTVRPGTTVLWVNDDPLAHTVVGTSGGFDSGSIEPGSTWQFRFNTAGQYEYSCRPHPFMKGTVIVAEP